MDLMPFLKTERDVLIKLSERSPSRFVCNLHAVFGCEKNVYFVMDYAPASDLRYHIVSKRSFTEEEISNFQSPEFIAACIILGLKKVHGAGILHMDIKPENIVMMDDGYCRLTDFGISVKLGDLKLKNFDAGTPGYCSPEVAQC